MHRFLCRGSIASRTSSGFQVCVMLPGSPASNFTEWCDVKFVRCCTIPGSTSAETPNPHICPSSYAGLHGVHATLHSGIQLRTGLVGLMLAGIPTLHLESSPEKEIRQGPLPSDWSKPGFTESILAFSGQKASPLDIFYPAPKPSDSTKTSKDSVQPANLVASRPNGQ